MGAAGCAAAAALIWIAVAFSASARWLDVAADHGFLDLQRPALVPIANAVSHSMDPAVLVLAGIALVAVALVRGRPRVAAAVPVILIGANVTTQLLKPALAYPRLSEWLGDRQISGASWPSGHSTAAMAIALCAVLVAPQRLRPAVAAIGAVYAVAIAYSLVTLGWHWPSDVLGGFLVAATWTLVAVAAGAAVVVVGALALAKPRPVLGYIAEHPAALTGALTIAALGTVLATGLALVLRR